MKKIVYSTENEKVAEQYFQLISGLRQGDETAIDKLTDLWTDDGVFEFAGTAPVIGTYTGKMAINSLYRNRFFANGMDVKLGGEEHLRIATMGIVETEVTHIREKENQVIAGWVTTIGTTEGEGFDISGSHLFTIEAGKIKNLKLNVSSKFEKSHDKSLSPDKLTIQDVGRLSLAAWPVV